MVSIETVLEHFAKCVEYEKEYQEVAYSAFEALTRVAGELERDESERGINFIRTFGRIQLYGYDGRNEGVHGIWYAIQDQKKIVVNVGKEIVRDTKSFLDQFNGDASGTLDLSLREELLRKITYDEVIRTLNEFMRR